jgi:hypothetical protein
MVFMTDSADHVTGKTGLTLTITASKAGAAFASVTPTVTERGSGWYSLAFTTSHSDTLGDLALHITGTGADPADLLFNVVANVEADTYGIVNHVTYGNSALNTAIGSISLASGAGALTTKTADSATLTTGSNTSGAYTDTASDNDVYWVTAPVTPAVGGFGLRQQLVFNLTLGRIPISILIRAYWNGSGQTGEVYALNSRTGVFDKLTNTGTNLASRTTELQYTLPLPRDYADSSGGVNNIVTLEFRSASTNTGHRLRLDQVLVTHVSEDIAATLIAPTTADIWSYVSRTLTEPGEEPVTVPTAAENAAATLEYFLDTPVDPAADAHIDSIFGHVLDSGTTWTYDRTTDSLEVLNFLINQALTRLGGFLGGDSTVKSYLLAMAGSGTALPTDFSGAGIDNATDSLQAIADSASTPPTADQIADEIETRTLAVTLTAGGLAAVVAAVEAEIADDATGEAVKQAIIDKLVENLPDLDDLSLAAISTAVWGNGTRTLTASGDPTAAVIASQVRTELTTELARIDVATSTRLATAGYTAPLSAAGTRTALGMADADLDVQLSAIMDGLDTVQLKTDNLPTDPADASVIDGALTTISNNVLAVAGYVDTEVAAIKAKTDLIPASPAAVGSPMTLDVTQAIASSQTDGTVGAALLGLEAQAVGKWEMVGTTLTLYRRDGVTVVRTFTLNAATNPTSRV